MRETVDFKDFSIRMKSKLLKVAHTRKFSVSAQALQDNLFYTVDQIIIPSINELKKAKYFEKSGLELSSVFISALNFYSALLLSIKHLGNMEQTLIKIALITILYSVGC